MRSFNRFYTTTIGALDDHHEGLDMTLGQSRLLYAVSRLVEPEVSVVADALSIDLAYTSRLLGSLEDRGLVHRSVSSKDRRRRSVELTADGRRALAEVEHRSNERMLGLIDHLSRSDADRLLDAMNTIQNLITDREHTDATDTPQPSTAAEPPT